MHLPPDNPVSAWLRRRYPQRQFLDPDEVAANRNGELTPSQRAALNLQLAQESLIAIGFLLLGAGLPLYVAALPLLTPSPYSTSNDPLVLVMLLGAGLLGLPGIMNGLRRWKIFFATRRDIAENQIVFATGRVLWSGDQYLAWAGRKRLRPIYDKLNLPLGTYRFFYLRNGRWLLSAEKLPPPAEFDATADMQRVLATANGFNLSELAANQVGQITRRQRFRLWIPAPISVRMPLMLAFAPWLFLALFACLALTVFDGLRYGLMVAGVLFVLAIGDMAAERVASVEGVGQRQVPQHRGDFHKYLLGGLRFRVSVEAYNALIVGRRYRVFYARFNKKLLSIELLAEKA